jgi:CheY-like chemotaxis protein
MNDAKPAVQILYAEDDPASGRLVKSIAGTEGYSVTIFGTGQEFLRALEDKPDLVLLDLHLPDAGTHQKFLGSRNDNNGAELVGAIRTDGKVPLMTIR